MNILKPWSRNILYVIFIILDPLVKSWNLWISVWLNVIYLDTPITTCNLDEIQLIVVAEPLFGHFFQNNIIFEMLKLINVSR